MNDRRSFLGLAGLGTVSLMLFGRSVSAGASTRFAVNRSPAEWRRILGPTRIGAHGTPVFFLHPKDMGGVLTELMETPKH
jgi:hypothetical protein